MKIAKELGLGRLEGRIWTASTEEIDRIRAVAATRASQAASKRKEARRAGRRAVALARASRADELEALRLGWRRLCETGSEEERAAWIEEHREELDGRVGREAFGIEPIASSALYFAVVAALKAIRGGRSAPIAINIAAKHYEVEVGKVAEIVGRIGGRKLSARKKGGTTGLKTENEWRDVDRSPEDLGLRSGRDAR